MPYSTPGRWPRAALMLVGLATALLLMEGTLRVIYRDAGERTLGGPGGQSFVHQTIDGRRRGRLDTGARTPGVPRVMIVGDSVTYGLGVREWTDTWPEQLARKLEAAGRPHEFAVFAVPGDDMPQHVEHVRGVIRQVQPDVLIYQWYVNDIEAISHRPAIDPFWRRSSMHEPLRSLSYTYFVLDHRLTRLLSHPGETYITYLTTEFVPGTLEWTEFEREFHEFGVLAQAAKRRIIMLYPQVPYRGEYPLQALHERMRELVGPHLLQIPPVAWTRSGAALLTEENSPWGQTVHPITGAATVQLQTRDYVIAPGDVELHVAIAAPEHDVGAVSLVDPVYDTTLVSAPIHGTGRLADVVLHLRVTGDRLRRLAVRVTTPASEKWTVANIGLQVDYGFEVIDLTAPLNAFNSHASSFDSHPNERAHELMAATVFDVLQDVH